MTQQTTRNLFDEDNIRLVREVLSHQPLGLAIDIDGTISEIAATPDEASVTEECRKWLAFLRKHLCLVAAVSGRSASAARAMVGVESLLYLGNHGLERWECENVRVRPDATPYLQTISRSLSELAGRLHLDGLSFENKEVTAAIHFRNAKRPELAREAILHAIKESRIDAELRITEGKMVIELRPPVEANKGIAIKELVKEYKLAALIYIGDDLTDVDAFVALRELRAAEGIRTLAIGVVGSETPVEVLRHADLVLNGVPEVERFLMWLSQEVSDI